MGRPHGDRMVGLADHHLERLLRSVEAGLAGRQRGANDLAVAPAEVRAVLFAAVAPAAYGDDPVVFFPFGKGGRGEMIADHSATVGHVVDKGLLRGLRPVVALIVQHHQLVGGKVGLETAHVLPFGGRGGYVHGEQVRVFQQLLQDGRGFFPIVGVLAVDNQGLHRRRRRRGSHDEPDNQRGPTTVQIHGYAPAKRWAKTGGTAISPSIALAGSRYNRRGRGSQQSIRVRRNRGPFPNPSTSAAVCARIGGYGEPHHKHGTAFGGDRLGTGDGHGHEIAERTGRRGRQTGDPQRRRPSGRRVALGGGPRAQRRPGQLARWSGHRPAHPGSRQNAQLLSQPRRALAPRPPLAHLRTVGGLGRRSAPLAAGAVP